jgi:predicted DNA-binding transcriptional regulator AlpA
MKTLLTENEASLRLGVSDVTLANWRKAGKAPECYRVGRGFAYDPGVVDGWMARHMDSDVFQWVGRKGPRKT